MIVWRALVPAAGTSGTARARSLCCPARSLRCAVSRRAGKHTGNTCAAQPGATRAALRAHSAALCSEGARGAASSKEGARCRAKKKRLGESGEKQQ